MRSPTNQDGMSFVSASIATQVHTSPYLLIKKIKRVGHGFRNFTNYRLRLLLHCGGIQWQTPQTARVRGRQPRFAA